MFCFLGNSRLLCLANVDLVKYGHLSLSVTETSDNERIFPLIYLTRQAVCSEISKSFISLLWPELLPTSILCPVNSGSKFFFYDKFCPILFWLVLILKHMAMTHDTKSLNLMASLNWQVCGMR